MSKTAFEYYAKISDSAISNVEKFGRYHLQKEDEKRIVLEIIDKLKINATDSLLDIGSGTGNLSIPLSFFCSNLIALVNPNVIKVLKGRSKGKENFDFISGDFLNTKINNKFDKILIYSILHYLKDDAKVFEFIDKAISLIADGGKLLLGDIPNVSLKTRFINSSFGKKFANKWNTKLNLNKINNPIIKAEINDEQTPIFDDKLMLDMIEHIRSKNYNAYLMPQPSNLPFGYTCEDILVLNLEGAA